MTPGVFEQESVVVWTDYATLSPFLMTLSILIQVLYGPVRLQRLSQRMPTYEKLMQNVGIRLGRKKKNQRKPFPERIQSVCITY